ncbi:MAG: hypothetical protein M3008_05520 [Chloroflexota bacterium]|nr:hypothetical protein [Chloroflexota bacterium]
MEKKARASTSPLAVAMPIGICILIAIFTDKVAVRAGCPTELAVAIACVIGLLWLTFLIGRLLA